MRKELKKLDGQRLRFRGVVSRFGHKTGWTGTLETILLTDIVLTTKGLDKSEQIVANHIWFTKGKSWKKCNVSSVVEFDARVSMYEKGYKGRKEVYDAPIRKDYKLERPTKVVVLS